MSASACKNTELIAGYTIKEQIGAGGYGEVWKAEAPGGLIKAIKFVHGHLGEERAACELKALNRIKQVRHPFLLSLERIEIVDSQLLIVTELADFSLKDRFVEYQGSGLPGIPRDELLVYLHDAADALDYMSENYSLQHLDIKPENLLVVGGRVKVADFGLVKDIRSATVSMMGGLTLVYASPEVFDGRPSLHSDQYGLAIVYQEMLTGALPFPGRTPAQLAAQHVNSSPRLSALPESDRAIIGRALAKDPNQRFPNCREMIENLLAGSRPVAGGVPLASVAPIEKLADTAAVKSQAADTSATPESDVIASPPAGEQDVTVTKTLVLDELPPATPSPATQPVAAQPVAAQPAVDESPPSEAVGKIKMLPLIEVQPEEIGLRPTLVVGLGGTAAKTLQWLHQRLRDRFENLSAVPALQLLLVDTDAHALAQAAHGEDGMGLDPQSSLAMPLRQRQDYRADSDEFLRWLSRRWLYNIPRSLQTEGLRPLGRLALVDHTEELFDRLRTAVAAMTDREALAASAEKTGLRIRNEAPRVFIVASISGGTGSGTVLDVAYAVRLVLAGLGIANGGVYGILAHSTGRRPEAKDLAVANAYACLTELNHLNRLGRNPGSPARRTPTCGEDIGPFDDTYLIHLGDGLGEADFNAATDMLAEYLYLDVATAAGAFFDKCRKASIEPDNSEDRKSTLRTFGLSQIGCSRTAIPSLATSRLCRKVVGRWCGLADDSTTDDVESGEPEGALHLELELDALTDQVYTGLNRKIGDDPKAYLQSCLEQGIVNRRGPGAHGTKEPPAARLFQTIDALLGSCGESYELPDVPESLLQRPLITHVKAIAAQRGAAVCDWILQFADTSTARLKASQLAADWAAERLSSLKEEVNERFRSRQAELGRLERSLWDTGNSRQSWRKRWLGIRRVEQQPSELDSRWDEYFKLRIDHLVLQAVGKLLRLLRRRVLAVGDQLKTFRRELDFLMDQFAVTPAEDGLARDDESPGPWDDLYASAAEALRDRTSELAAELDRQFQEGFFAKHGGLRGALEKNVQLRGPFFEKLQAAARTAVLGALNQINIAGLLLSPDRRPQESKQSLQALLEAAEPTLLGCGGSQRLALVCPEGPSNAPMREAIERHLHETPSVVHDCDGDLVLCYEAERLSLAAVAAGLIDHRRDYADVAARLHTRIDVAWSPLPQVEW